MIWTLAWTLIWAPSVGDPRIDGDIALEQRTTMDRASLAMNAALSPHGLQHAIEQALPDSGNPCRRQGECIHLRHQVAKHGALTAACRDHPVRGFFLKISQTGSSLDSGSTDLPIHRDRFNLGRTGDQTLVTQVSQDQQFRHRAQGHQRDELTLIDKDRQRALGRDMDRASIASFVSDLDLAQQFAAGLGQPRRIFDAHPIVGGPIEHRICSQISPGPGEQRRRRGVQSERNTIGLGVHLPTSAAYFFAAAAGAGEPATAGAGAAAPAAGLAGLAGVAGVAAPAETGTAGAGAAEASGAPGWGRAIGGA